MLLLCIFSIYYLLKNNLKEGRGIYYYNNEKGLKVIEKVFKRLKKKEYIIIIIEKGMKANGKKDLKQRKGIFHYNNGYLEYQFKKENMSL